MIGALTLTYDYYWSFYEPCEEESALYATRGSSPARAEAHTAEEGSEFTQTHVGLPPSNMHTLSITIQLYMGNVGLCTTVSAAWESHCCLPNPQKVKYSSRWEEKKSFNFKKHYGQLDSQKELCSSFITFPSGKNTFFKHNLQTASHGNQIRRTKSVAGEV